MQDVPSLDAEAPGLLVKLETACRQIDAETPPEPPTPPPSPEPPGPIPPGPEPPLTPAKTAKRYHGSVPLDPTRVGRDASRVADEVIAHLGGLVGAKLRVTLEIEAELPKGISEQVIRTVTENSRTLRFKSHGFEKE